MKKYISSDRLCDLAEVVLKNNTLNLAKNMKAKKKDCNWIRICTSLYYSVYDRTGRGNSLKNRI